MFNRALVFRHSRQLGVVASLVLSTLLCIGLLVLRVAHSHHSTYSWLWWNLLLAWLPLGFALVAYNVSWHQFGFRRLIHTEA